MSLTRDEVLARLAAAGAPDVPRIAPLLHQAVWLRLDPDRQPGLLESRFGGPAMVSPDFEWPYYAAEPYMGGGVEADGTFAVRYGEGTAAPLTMIAQLNLSEVPIETALPRAGLLSFFTDPFDGVWGGDLADRSGFEVVYTPAEELSRLEPRPAPVSMKGGAFAGAHWPQYAISFELRWALSDRAWIRELEGRDEELAARVEQAWSEVSGYAFGHFLLDAGRNHSEDPREHAVALFDPVATSDDEALD